MSQFPSQGEKENPLKTAPIKDTVADSDGVVLVDGQDAGTKRVLWSTIKSALGQIFAPLTRKINNKSLSSDVVLTGDDIATSATDGTTVSSSLSNLESSKLNKTLRAGSGQDLNAIIPSSGSIEVYRVFNPSANVPPGYTENSCDFFLIAICEAAQLYVRQYAFDVRSTAIWTRRSYDDSGVIHWQDWKQIVLATPPQEFDLPLASGWSNYSGMRSRYWKNQFDEVSVVVDISNPNTVSHGAVVATLPEGFRPAAAFDAPTIIYDGSEILPVRAYFSTNGQISISGYSNQTWSKVLFFETQASFIAVS